MTVKDPLATHEAVRRHIEFKLAAGDLKAAVGARMLVALEAGGPVDYAALHHAASFPDPPAIVYHTAPVAARPRILAAGLEKRQPGPGGAWAHDKGVSMMLEQTQSPGVYVGAEPDTGGMWSHWSQWDVWKIYRAGIEWGHDTLNPGCWVLRAAVPTDALHLFGTFGVGP